MIELTKAWKILEVLQTTEASGQEYRHQAMELISELEDYNWSGIYRLEGSELVLDAYVGDATDHVRIAVGQGVCGTAVAENKNQVVEDVSSLHNYLSCSIKTKSEIVVLIRRDGQILGQIDIDGHRVGAFGKSDEQFLQEVATLLADRWD